MRRKVPPHLLLAPPLTPAHKSRPLQSYKGDDDDDDVLTILVLLHPSYSHLDETKSNIAFFCETLQNGNIEKWQLSKKKVEAWISFMCLTT